MEFGKERDPKFKIISCYSGLFFFLKTSKDDDHLIYVLEADDTSSQQPKSDKSEQSKVC